MTVKVFSKTGDNVHLWNYFSFKEHHNAKTTSHNSSGNTINYMVYDVDGPIDEQFTSSLGLDYEILEWNVIAYEYQLAW